MSKLQDVFEESVTEELIDRINRLSSNQERAWGTMSVDQMLAHCSKIYELALGEKEKKPSGIARMMMRLVVKPIVVGKKPYKQGTRTAPGFKVLDEREFEKERERLISYLRETYAKGRSYFEGRDYPNFGKMSAEEYSRMFYKHLDHHLRQFKV